MGWERLWGCIVVALCLLCWETLHSKSPKICTLHGRPGQHGIPNISGKKGFFVFLKISYCFFRLYFSSVLAKDATKAAARSPAAPPPPPPLARLQNGRGGILLLKCNKGSRPGPCARLSSFLPLIPVDTITQHVLGCPGVVQLPNGVAVPVIPDSRRQRERGNERRCAFISGGISRLVRVALY